MGQVQFAVILQNSAWRLLVNGKAMGRFSARDAALSCACEMARLTRADGLAVEVLAQDPYGEVTAFPRAIRRASAALFAANPEVAGAPGAATSASRTDDRGEVRVARGARGAGDFSGGDGR